MSATMEDPQSQKLVDRHRKRAMLRLVLGLLQIMGASAGLYLMLRTGLAAPTLIVVLATLALSFVSRLVFARSSELRR